MYVFHLWSLCGLMMPLILSTQSGATDTGTPQKDFDLSVVMDSLREALKYVPRETYTELTEYANRMRQTSLRFGLNPQNEGLHTATSLFIYTLFNAAQEHAAAELEQQRQLQQQSSTSTSATSTAPVTSETSSNDFASAETSSRAPGPCPFLDPEWIPFIAVVLLAIVSNTVL